MFMITERTIRPAATRGFTPTSVWRLGQKPFTWLKICLTPKRVKLYRKVWKSWRISTLFFVDRAQQTSGGTALK